MKRIRFERNKIILAIIDILIIALACIFSKFLLSNTFYFKAEEWKQIGITIALSIVIYQIFFRIFNLYRSITRYENGRDYLIYIFVCAISCITTYIIKNIFKIDTFTTKECILSCVLIAVGTVSCRVVIRMLLNETLPAEKKNDEPVIAKRLLIIGAGRSSRDIIKAIREGLKNTYYIVGLIDDNPAKWNCSISGVKILGNRDKIQEVCKKYNVQEIFFSITNISPENKKELLHICQETNAKIRILPSTEDIIKNKNVLDSLKDVEIEDLLGRDPIKLDNNNIESLIKGHAILVTGGGGSIGSELCRQIASFNPELLIIFDIYENNLYNIELELRAKYPNLSIKGIIGSVRDKKKLEDVFSKYRPYLVFHAAAHKHVPLMEVSPLEAIKNNVLGTQNVADCADKFGTKRFILISTDKAVNPTNIMGASKRMCEMVIQAKNKTSKTEYAAVRFGNVLGSNGSVVPSNPSELLITPQMQRLLDKLSSQCDIIIVDAPPCELVTDAAILSRIVDSTIVVTAHKFTKKANLQKTIKSIKNVGGRIAGVVLNKVPIDAKKYEKSYYYGSQLTTTRGKREAGRAVSKKDFFEEEHKKPVEDKVKIEKEVVKNEKTEEPKQNEKVENDMPDKTQEILRQVNEYLQQERNNLNDTKRDN